MKISMGTGAWIFYLIQMRFWWFELGGVQLFFLCHQALVKNPYFFLEQYFPVLRSIYLCAVVDAVARLWLLRLLALLCKGEPQFSSEILSDPFFNFSDKECLPSLLLLKILHFLCTFFSYSFSQRKGTRNNLPLLQQSKELCRLLTDNRSMGLFRSNYRYWTPRTHTFGPHSSDSDKTIFR